MSTSISSPDDSFFDAPDPRALIRVFESAGFPPPRHAAEPDLFVRQQDVPGHDQAALADARILIVGAGGLGSWTALALARSGARSLTIVEPDRFDRTNAPRQLMFGRDVGEPKAIACARNIVDHMVAGGQIVAIPLPFAEANVNFLLPADAALFLVDNNSCRFAGIRFAREQHIPAVFAMLSGDGMRVHAFLQGADPDDACLHCALPNLDPDASAPCAAATITSCFLAAAFAVFFAHRAVMGWPHDVPRFNWREADLLGVAPDSVGTVTRRRDCPTCGHLS